MDAKDTKDTKDAKEEQEMEFMLHASVLLRTLLSAFIGVPLKGVWRRIHRRFID